MKHVGCDAWTRRRFGITTASALVAFGLARTEPASAKKGKKTLKRNHFGCVNVGGACRGKDAVCCSGICQGTKPKNGKKDTSRCVVHDASTCRSGQVSAPCGGSDISCTTSANAADGKCLTTTGGAPYCARDAGCFACKKDAECEPFCGAGAACVPCADFCASKGLKTACAGLAKDSCSFPLPPPPPPPPER